MGSFRTQRDLNTREMSRLFRSQFLETGSTGILNLLHVHLTGDRSAASGFQQLDPFPVFEVLWIALRKLNWKWFVVYNYNTTKRFVSLVRTEAEPTLFPCFLQNWFFRIYTEAKPKCVRVRASECVRACVFVRVRSAANLFFHVHIQLQLNWCQDSSLGTNSDT